MKIFRNLAILTLAAISVESKATLFLDLEEDSIPVVSMTVILPVGFQAYKPEDSGVFNLLSDIFDQGSESVDRKKFNQTLASFGASTSLGVRNESTAWSMEFPYVAGKDYEPLFNLLAAQFKTPRFNADSLRLAKLKLTAAIQSTLDNDAALVRSTAVRIRAFKDFQSFPVLPDVLEKISLNQVTMAYKREFLKAMDGWVGLVAPKAALNEIEKGLTQIFPNLGPVKEGIKKTPLEFAARKDFNLKPYSAAIIIDRPDRAQTVTSFSWLKAGTPNDMKAALSHAFGGYVLSDSGLNSYLGEEIRTKRGLAYSVGGIDDVYLGTTIMGFMANPQRVRNAESTDVFGEAVKNAYEEAVVFSLMSPSDWSTRFKSYQYDNILSERTASGRLARRSALVEGDLFPEMALSSPESWSITQSAVTDYFRKEYAGSSRMLVLVGDSKELTPIVEKAFPNFKIVSVPYKDLLKTETYKKLATDF